MKTEELVQTLEQILEMRQSGKTDAAFKLFKKLKVSNFPKDLSFPMAHGLQGDPEGLLFYIDHDWDDHGCFDPEIFKALTPKDQAQFIKEAGFDPTDPDYISSYCNLFIQDGINALKAYGAGK